MNHERRFIYVKHAKTAGTTVVRELLEKQLCAAQQLPKNKCKDKPWKMLFSHPVHERVRLWKEYTTIAFVRDPFSRAQSMYSYLGLAKLNITWAEFTENPMIVFSQCSKVAGCNTGSIVAHVMPQCPCTFSDDGAELYVDMLGSTQHLQQDVERMVELINQNNPDLPPLRPHSRDRNVCTEGKCPAKPQWTTETILSLTTSYAADVMFWTRFTTRKNYDVDKTVGGMAQNIRNMVASIDRSVLGGGPSSASPTTRRSRRPSRRRRSSRAASRAWARGRGG